MSHRKLVRLKDRYPTASRMTLWRISNEPGFPAAVVIRNTKYRYEDELDAYEEARRHLGKTMPKRNAAEAEAT